MDVFLLSFTTILIAELGDKTQMTTFLLASCGSALKVYLGALTALAFITALIIFLGNSLVAVMPQTQIRLAGGILFILIGVLNYFEKTSIYKLEHLKSSPQIFLQSFGLVFVAELGDKTQLAALSLAAVTGSPFFVFMGAVSAQAINHGLAAWLGKTFFARISNYNIKIISSFIFVIIGLALIFYVLQ